MSEDENRIRPARIEWKDGAPHSAAFGDVYFSEDGPAETDHVFLNGNDLPARFKNTDRFSIGELGFGTGLNFLKAWELWSAAPNPPQARLRFFSVEAFPLSLADLERAQAAWPELAPLAARLRAAMPPIAPGFHQLNVASSVTLILAYGEAGEMLARAEGGVDAWFLDGFSPAKNPGMWRAEVLNEIARLSRPGATFATFTVAGEVRRTLASAGFAVEKRAGHGRKKEMLAGRIDAPPRKSRRTPWFGNAKPLALSPGASVAIIGGGIAGASLACEATRAGLRPAIFDPHGLAAGASGNPAGLIMPRLDLGGSPAAQFFVAAYLHTVRLLNELGAQAPQPARPGVLRDAPPLHPEGFEGRRGRAPQDEGRNSRAIGRGVFNPCGALLGAADEEERARQEKILAANVLPDGWVEARNGGLFFPQAGVVSPPDFVAALAGETPVVAAKVSRIVSGETLEIELADGTRRSFDAVVIANGIAALAFLEARSLPLIASAGQIDWFPEAAAPENVIAFGPYAAPAPRGGLVIGATYEKIAQGAAPSVSRKATEENLAAVARFAPDLAAGLDAGAAHSRAAIRCQTPDRLPIAGALPDLAFFGGAYDDLRVGKDRDYPLAETIEGIFILSGLGSRGLVTAPLAAAMVVAEMTGSPSPVSFKIAEALHPARFFIRELRRAHPSRRPVASS